MLFPPTCFSFLPCPSSICLTHTSQVWPDALLPALQTCPPSCPWLSLLLRLQHEPSFLGRCLPRGREWSRETSHLWRGSQDLPSQPRSWAAVSQEAAEPSPAQKGRAGPADHPALSLRPSKASTLGPRLQCEWINWQNPKPVARYLVLLSNVKSQEGEISHVCFSFLTPPSLLPRGY